MFQNFQMKGRGDTLFGECTSILGIGVDPGFWVEGGRTVQRTGYYKLFDER